jgi:hypothetical protein
MLKWANVFLSLFIANCAVAAPCKITFHENATLAGRKIKLGDVARLNDLPAPVRSKAAALVLGLIPNHMTTVKVSTATVARRARSMMPALSPCRNEVPQQHISLKITTVANESVTIKAAAAPQNCLRVLRPVPARHSLTRRDVDPVSCIAGATTVPLHYDHARRVFSLHGALAKHELIALQFRPNLPDVASGDAVTIGSTVGPVQVARSATALQSAWAGQAFFVRTQQHDVLSVTLPRDQP